MLIQKAVFIHLWPIIQSLPTHVDKYSAKLQVLQGLRGLYLEHPSYLETSAIYATDQAEMNVVMQENATPGKVVWSQLDESE
jgi:hypothetical protein